MEQLRLETYEAILFRHLARKLTSFADFSYLQVFFSSVAATEGGSVAAVGGAVEELLKDADSREFSDSFLLLNHPLGTGYCSSLMRTYRRACCWLSWRILRWFQHENLEKRDSSGVTFRRVLLSGWTTHGMKVDHGTIGLFCLLLCMWFLDHRVRTVLL